MFQENAMEERTFDPDGVGVANGSYFGLPFEPETSELVLISAPWDVTVSYGAGTAYAPDAIIEASTQLDFHDPLAPGVWRRGIATADVESPRPTWTIRCWSSRSACGAMPNG